MTIHEPLSASLMVIVLFLRSSSIACLSSLGMLEAKDLGCMSANLSFVACRRPVMEAGSSPGVPVNFL